MNANRLWIIGGALAAVAIAVLAYFVGISPQLAQAGAADQQKAQAQAQLQQAEVALAALKKQYASIGELTAQLAALQQAVPGTAKVTDFVRQVQGQASDSGAAIDSITVGEATPYAPQAAPAGATSGTATAAATPAPAPASSAPASSAPAPTPTADATAPAVAPPLATDPSVTASNFVLLPVSISASGSQPQLMSFTRQLQQTGPRLFLIDSIDVNLGGSGAPGGAATASISGFVYVLVGD
jgi:Tfp pilus assembly protein PilO